MKIRYIALAVGIFIGLHLFAWYGMDLLMGYMVDGGEVLSELRIK